MMISTLTPAYGRDYKSKKAVEEDFNANKDFIESLSGQYINKEQLIGLGIKSINIHYKKLTQVCVVKVTP